MSCPQKILHGYKIQCLKEDGIEWFSNTKKKDFMKTANAFPAKAGFDFLNSDILSEENASDFSTKIRFPAMFISYP